VRVRARATNCLRDYHSLAFCESTTLLALAAERRAAARADAPLLSIDIFRPHCVRQQTRHMLRLQIE